MMSIGMMPRHSAHGSPRRLANPTVCCRRASASTSHGREQQHRFGGAQRSRRARRTTTGSTPTKGGGAKGEYRRQTVAVDSFEPNPWGLYNVHGNVWEWTEDCWNKSNNGNPGDGGARTTGSEDCGVRVLRGGSWIFGPRFLRSAARFPSGSTWRTNFHGFRLARTLDP